MPVPREVDEGGGRRERLWQPYNVFRQWQQPAASSTRSLSLSTGLGHSPSRHFLPDFPPEKNANNVA